MQIEFFRPLKLSLTFGLFCWIFQIQAMEVTSHHTLNWEVQLNKTIANKSFPWYYTFQGAYHNSVEGNELPVFLFKIKVNGTQNIKLLLRNEKYETLPQGNIPQSSNLIENNPNPNYTLSYELKNPYLIIRLIPLIKTTVGYQKLTSFDLSVTYDIGNQTNRGFSKTNYAPNSVLASGTWFKIGVNQSGIHSLSKSYLRSIGMDVNNIDPRTIKIFGIGPGMLAQKNKDFRYDDLPQNAILVEGESDGVLNDNDRILFYGRAQKDVWKYNTATGRYNHQTNVYSDITYYFITSGGAAGKRISTLPIIGNANTTISEYDQLYVHETESYNLIKSGRRWMGEEFNRINTYSFPVNMGSVNTSEPVYFLSSVAAKSFTPSSFNVTINGSPIFTQSVPPVIADYESAYADDALNSALLTVNNSNLVFSYNYSMPIPGSVGWLDYFEVQSRNFLTQTDPQLHFRDAKSVGTGKVGEFSINASSPLNIWDITEPANAKNISTNTNGSTVTFIAATDSLREFIAFTGNQFLSPISAVPVANQNLHGLAAADLFIITHNQFVGESQVLADFHRNQSSLKVHVVTVDQIYNEFASGSQDISAIRDFLRMFYKRTNNPSEMPKYVTLFGRASYDFKNRIANNTNFVPTYESIESFSPIGSYNSDDYFGLLDDTEGKWDAIDDSKEFLDVAIGRLPAQDNIQASNMVNKIINYALNPELADWKTKLVFVADDEDYNTHLTGSNNMANRAITEFKNYNTKKIFIDAYNEENTAGGARNPSAQSEIVRSVEQGALIVNYTGHGGEVGWAGERILNTDDINSWSNGKKLPLFVTATCEFSRFDDPGRTSAGEMVLLNPNGGGIALFTTVRLVFSSANDRLNSYFYDRIGLDSLGLLNPNRMGEVMRLTKNDYAFTDKNERNFTLLGDPALFLAYPKHRVQTVSIQNAPVGNIPDTLKAFSKVTVAGKVTDIQNNLLPNFNGVVYTTIYDKPATYRTIGNNPTSSVVNFSMQNNVIYRGKASVVNGLFTFSFIVPKDISYEIGFGKISYLAENGKEDAIGNYQRIIIGGTADSIPPDGVGPDIRLFLNDEKFVYGGITSQDPTLIVKLYDDNGINITGRGVGRDIGLTLNNDVTKTTSLNDYFQAKLDSYQAGEARYKMSDLPTGKNTLKIRAYDVYNNSSDALLEFVVTNSEEIALQHVLNYPNPFTTNTTFHFDHNKAGETMTVQIQIFTISGKIVKNLQTEVVTAGNHFDQLNWDGKDDYGDNIGKGVYVYKVKVKSNTGKSAEEYQKLVILN